MLFYEEGVTESFGRLLKAVDGERIAIGQAVGVDILPDPDISLTQGYMAEPTYDVGYSKAPAFRGIKAQSSLDNRYFQEDVGYGLLFLPLIQSNYVYVNRHMTWPNSSIYGPSCQTTFITSASPRHELEIAVAL